MNFVEALKAFRDSGCSDRTKCALACRVYLDLKEDSRVAQLERVYDESLDLLYLRGRRDDDVVNFVPVLSCQALDLTEIERIQEKLGVPGEELQKSVTLAICDTTSTILYYQMTSGVVEQKTALAS